MFDRIGRLTTRYRWPIIIGWIILAVVITLIAPNFDDVASSNASDFLPDNAPYQQAIDNLLENFPDEYSAGSAVIVLETDASVREGPAHEALLAVTAWLESDDAPQNITEVLSPGSGVPLVSDSLIAPDDQLAFILLEFNTDVHSPETVEALETLNTYLDAQLPSGVTGYLTGSSPIISSYSEAALTSIDRTLGITVALVVLMLLLVYRSPVSPLVPLVTVSLSYLITRGIVSWIGANFMLISTYANAMMIVVLFGAGTDYCLFLISRFREEMADRDSVEASTEHTVHRVGETITSSAGTVIVGFVTMSFAEMGLFRTTGPALAIGVVVVLLAGLSLTPALLTVLGQRAFWPGKATHRNGSGPYARISLFVSDHPIWTIVLITAVLAPLALYGTGQQVTYDMLADLPAEDESRQGFAALERHVGGGQIQPMGVILNDLDPDSTLAEIDYWTTRLLEVDGVASVRSLSSPLGQDLDLLNGITRIDRQLGIAADLLAQVTAEGPNPELMTTENIQAALGALPFVQQYLNQLEADFPQVSDDAHLTGLRQTIAGLPLAALTGNLTASMSALQEDLAGLSATFAEVENAYYWPEELPAELTGLLGGEEDPLDAIAGRYITPDRTAARMEIVLAGNPYGDEATDVVRELRDIVPNGPSSVTGYPAIITDMRDTMDRDMVKAFSLVLLGIFIVLLFLLRALVSPVYMIVTILLSYGATMGITRLASGLFFGTQELTWWVPFFMFDMLVALGMDYNIFLMGRVKEEAAQHGVREGVHRAVAATGAIITSAGIIMAGTFAAMTAGVITGLKQIGLAVAVGVLLDTFIIRTALVPAIAVMLDRWNWWPGKAPSVQGKAVPQKERITAPGD